MSLIELNVARAALNQGFAQKDGFRSRTNEYLLPRLLTPQNRELLFAVSRQKNFARSTHRHPFAIPCTIDNEAYPVLTFKSTRVEAVGAGALKITGDLTVHGITRSVVLEARTNKILTPSKGKPSAGFDADARLLRSDFGVGRYVPMVGDELSVHITVELHEPD